MTKGTSLGERKLGGNEPLRKYQHNGILDREVALISLDQGCDRGGKQKRSRFLSLSPSSSSSLEVK